MNSYHFSLGNSTNGPVGFCARVRAETPERALALLKIALPEAFEVVTHKYNRAGEGIEYLTAYFNDEPVSLDDQEESPAPVPALYTGHYVFDPEDGILG